MTFKYGVEATERGSHYLENFGTAYPDFLKKDEAFKSTAAEVLSDSLNSISDSFLTANSAYTTSVLQAQKDLQAQANAFNAGQAELNRQFQQASAERAMQFESEEAQKNRDFQTVMANTQYQRAIEDMKKAGLNPVLAYSHLLGSTPSGATASGKASSGSQASWSNAGSLSSAKDADKLSMSDILPVLLISVVNSAMQNETIQKWINRALG